MAPNNPMLYPNRGPKDAKDVWMKPEAEQAKRDVEKAHPLNVAYESWRAESKNPSKAVNANGALLKALKPTIDSALTSYGGGSGESLRTQAHLMALDAAKRFDPTKGIQLNTFVFSNLQSLRRKAAERSNMIKVPEGVLLDANKIEKERNDLEVELGREPTAHELADKTGLSLKRLERISQGVGAQIAESQTLNEKGDTLFTKAGDPQKIWSDMVYHDLDPIDKKIFEWSTGYGGASRIKKGEMAQKLRISQPAVSARINKIVAKLEEGYNIGR